jgi:phenylpropionate dioxygenase-like ring-hydroxylating dioxygenase large terminal subunit
MIIELGKTLFQRYWHLVCHKNELPRDKDYLRFKTPIGDAVIFNDGGNYVAFDNRCAHRGALIYPDFCGTQANVCKYHGWAFRSGKLIIPSVDQFGSCGIDAADINRYHLDWCGDFLFLGISPEKSLLEQLEDVSIHLEKISLDISGRLDLAAYDYECAWPIAIENALEPYHIEMVHRSSLAKLRLGQGLNSFYGLNSIWQAPIGADRVQRQLTRLDSFFDIEYGFLGYSSIFIFPFSMISSTFGYSYSLQNFFPHQKREDRTHFMCRFLASRVKDARAEEIVKPFFDSSIAMNRQIFDEDHLICKTLPADAWGVECPRYLSDQEVKIAHFREMCRLNLTGN